MRKRTILFVGGGAETVDAIDTAHAMGLYTVVSDAKETCPAFAKAGAHILASTYDVEKTVESAIEFSRHVRPIDGVLTIGADVPLTVASVAEALGLPGLPVSIARLGQDKLAMKQRFAETGVPIPWFTALENPAALTELVREHGHGFVVKPTDSRGSRGVQRISPGQDLEEVWQIASRHALSGRVMAERYLPGPQVSTESILIDGMGYTPGFSDRNYELLERYHPYFIENGGDLPSTLPADVQRDVALTAENAGLALGIRTGNIKGDMVVYEGKSYVIELALRASGGHFCTREIPLNTGVDFVRALIKLALGDPVDPSELRPRFNRPVAQRFAFPRAGRVIRVEGAERARAVAGVASLDVLAAPGSVISQPVHAGFGAAMVLATGDTIEAASTAANRALELLIIETVP